MARRRHRWTDLTSTIQRVSVPSVIGDREGTVTWLNDAATDLLGDLRGRSFYSVVAPEDVPLAKRELDRMLAGVPVTDFELEMFTRDGRRVRAEVSSVPIVGGDRGHAVFGIGQLREPPSTALSHPRLTSRQNDVLQLLGQGASTDQIAAQLHLSKETVRNHVRHVLQALGAHSRLEAVALARRDQSLPDR